MIFIVVWRFFSYYTIKIVTMQTFLIFFNIFIKKKRGVNMANKTKKLLVRILSGVMAGLLLLGCIAMAAII